MKPNTMNKKEILRNLQTMNTQFEKAENDLNTYMEEKRSSFPRFYFISDDDLLKILSTATEVTATEKHLSKVFEAIQKLQYSGATTPSHMISPEGEAVKFLSKSVSWNKGFPIE